MTVAGRVRKCGVRVRDGITWQRVRMSEKEIDTGTVRPEIALSWRRSHLSGVNPSTSITINTTGVDPNSRLLRAAAPVLDQISQQIVDTGFCVLLADRDGRIVASLRADDRRIRRAVERLGVVNGSLLGEDCAGTNAVGTPLEVGHSIVIHGEEHYLDSFKGISCYGQPVIHPVTRRVEGILDMTGAGARANPLFAPFLARAAADIETRLLEGSKASEQRLFSAFQRVPNRNHVAVAAIGDDFLLTNRTAMDLLATADHVSLRSLAVDLAPDQSRLVTVHLVSGAQATVKVDRVSGANGGALFTIQEADRPERAAIPRSRDHRLSHSERLQEELQRARRRVDALSISGEPGTGRTTAVADVVGETSVSWFNATSIAFDGTEAWTSRLIQAIRERDAVVIEQIELLPASVLPIISDLVAAEEGSPRIILTSGPISDLPPAIAGVATRCPTRIHLAPLRERHAEIAELAQSILAGLAPGYRLAPNAVEALAAAQWSGNIAELKVVLRSAVDASSSPRIDVPDLPEDYRVTARAARLGGRERAERQAIAEALKSCGGNKSHASAQLGISRSTLYARMRALDVAG